jgi:hypothetical protein
MSLYVPYYRPYDKHNTNIHDPGGIRTLNPSKRAAADHALDRTDTGIGTLSGSSIPTFRDFLSLEYGTDRLFRNVDRGLLLNAA